MLGLKMGSCVLVTHHPLPLIVVSYEIQQPAALLITEDKPLSTPVRSTFFRKHQPVQRRNQGKKYHTWRACYKEMDVNLK